MVIKAVLTDEDYIDQPLGAYRGNALLKQIGEEINWNEHMLSEYMKCSKDPLYFIENYVKIVHLDEGLVPFVLRDYQKEMIQTAADNRFTIIATARQVGKSTTMTAYILWYILFSQDKTVALLANKGETAREILGRVHTSYQNLPKWMQQGVVSWNKGSIHLENGSRIIAAATSSSAIRGYSINMIMLDECAFIEGWDEFESSVIPTISSSKASKIIMVSTPNGLNHFYKYWIEAREGKNNYKPVMVNWNQVPGRDEEWRKETLASMGGSVEKFNTEYGVEFQGSSGTLIAGWKLKELVHRTPEEHKDGLSMYIPPIPEHIYVLVADTSHGKGLDSSAFHVFDITTMPFQICSTFRSNVIVPSDYADLIHRVGTSYNKAYVLAENNDMGEVVNRALLNDLEYDNMLFTTTNAGRGGKKLSGGATPNADIGIRTTKPVKSVGCSILKLLVEQNQLPIQDFHTIEELSRFSKKGNSYEAEPGCKDDLVMCLVLFAWLSGQDYFRELVDINTVGKIKEKNNDQFEVDMTPFGFTTDNRDEVLEAQQHKNWLFSDEEVETLNDF